MRGKPGGANYWLMPFRRKDFIEHIARDDDGLYPEVQEVRILTEILKLVKLPDPNNHLMTLLHFVSSECDPPTCLQWMAASGETHLL